MALKSTYKLYCTSRGRGNHTDFHYTLLIYLLVLHVHICWGKGGGGSIQEWVTFFFNYQIVLLRQCEIPTCFFIFRL